MSGSEIVVILLLALVVLGPEKLPDAIRKFGRTYAELKKMGTGFQQEFKSALDEPMREMRETADLLKKSADFSGPEPVAEQLAPASDASISTATSPPTDASPPTDSNPPPDASPPTDSNPPPDASLEPDADVRQTGRGEADDA
jgi:sec-independent protein translocase protein TatB